MSSLPDLTDDDTATATTTDDDEQLDKTNSKSGLDNEIRGDNVSTSLSVTSTALDDDKSSLIMTATATTTETPNEVKEPVQVFGNRSIEIFFGSLKTFHNFYQMLCETGVGIGVPGDSSGSRKTKVKPESIKKLVLVGHPVTSFSGINLFVKLVECWVTNCCIPEAKWSDFNGLIHLHKLFIYNCQLNKIEPFYFQNLRVLWLAGNNLTSLNFLGQGLVSLNELNVARNEITCLLEEQLFKSVNLQRLNLSGNPLCILQDVQAIKVLSSLQTLHLADPVYGKCPVATLCDSRAMLLSVLTKITSLDGKKVTSSEMTQIQEYITSRCIYYYANSIRGLSSHVALRKSGMSSTSKQMETIGARLLELVSLAAKYRRTISSVEVVPIFTNAKNLMKDQLMKIENRMMKLKEWKEVTTKRLEIINQISSWEQEAEKWMKWIEYQSFGNTQCRIAHSVHGPTISDGGSLCGIMHELLSSLACPGLWPQSTMLKLESVMVVRDKGMEAGMERVFYDYFALKDEPKFVPPAPDAAEIKEPSKSSQYSTMHGPTMTMSPQFPYCPPPSVVSKPVTSYMTPDYKPPPPIYPFPDSVPGLPERAQPLFMFLVCPQTCANNPLLYLQRILLDKSRYYKDIRVTNCLWLASHHHNKPVDGTYSVVIIVKVLEECLQPINLDRRGCSVTMRHSWDCSTFSVKRPLAFAPAYIVNISFTHENKQAIWHKSISDDDDVLIPAETALTSLLSKIQAHGHPPVTRPGRAKSQPHMKRIGDGFHADLSAVQLNVTKDGNYEILDTVRSTTTTLVQSAQIFDLHNVSKLLGRDASQFLTSLDLSGNRLGLTVGLDNLATLKKLNLSHNNLTTLTGLQKLPSLIELKAGWNHLRFLHSNVSTLAWVSPRLMSLEILPNPFQDVHDLSHIPLLFSKVLPLLHRVDIWTAPFSAPPSAVPFAPPHGVQSLASFAQAALAEYWVGTAYNYNDLVNKCLTDLVTHLPTVPPFPPGYSGTGIDLNLSYNYLNSACLQNTALCTSTDWRASLTILQLQENMIENLDWVVGHVFPNCQILNLSLNQLDQVDRISGSFPNVKHLHLGGNPLPCDTNVLSTLRLLGQLITLDCTATPVASHPEYGFSIIKSLPNLKILDGSPTAQWELADATDKLGGILTPDWLEEKMGHRDWASLSQLSLANCGIQKISLPPQALPKLLSFDLQDNGLTSFSNLSSLPGLRVLCVSHNNISSLGGSPCPVCYTHTAQSQAVNAQKLRASKSSTSPNFYEWNGKTVNSGLSATHGANKGTGFDSFGMPIAHPGSKILPCHVRNDMRNTGAVAWGLNGVDDSANKIEPSSSSPPSTPVPPGRKFLSKPLFPRLEVLIMAHNGLNTAADLHLHSMQNLQTIILNCNNLTSLNGLENLPCVRAIVLDHNRIRDVPFNSLVGCKSLRYLHLEHNRLTSLPRLPHLTNLTALYLAYNKIQGLTDLNSLSGSGITELSMAGNPLATRSDYRLNVAARLGQLTTLDGKDLASERFKLGELARFPGSTNVIRDYVHHHDPCLYREDKIDNNNNFQQTEFGLRVKPLSTNLSPNSPRSLQYSAFKSTKRYNNHNNAHQDL